MQIFTLRNVVYWVLCLCFIDAKAQCGTTINTFPYIENFETGAAWTTGGPVNSAGNVVNDWAWGTPSKPVINAAGSGQKCWIIGGLTGLTYGTGERSYIQSPCFDFTNLHHPYITFLVFWESEWKYDGAVLQYSSNGGVTWTNLGSVNDAVDCLDSNWYNHSPISGLGSQSLSGTTFPALTTTEDGWCGNIQPTVSSCQGGNGSGRWVLARHCMAGLTGLPGVTFRFAFGAGTTCNTFDGFAIDSVCIREAPANTADFNYTCVGTNTIDFTGVTTLCPNAYSWNFGDLGSGASNTSADLIPTHTFSGTGAYNVTFTDSGGCNASGTVTKTIQVISLSVVGTAGGCNTGGSAIAQISGNAAPYNYAWSTSPVQTGDTATNLSPGNYTVTVTTPNACSATASVTITQATPLTHTVVIDSASCGNNNGSITIHERGGTPAYTFTWTPTGSDSTTSNLAAGTYSVTITDSRGCRDSLIASIYNTGGLQATANVIKNVSCFGGSDGEADVTALAGSGTLTYLWSTTATTDTVNGLAPGTYTVTVSIGSNCSVVKNVTITQPAILQHIVDSMPASCGNNNGSIAIHESGGTGSYTYSWSPTGSGDSSANLSPGVYTLTAVDQNGCRDSLTATVISTSVLTVKVDSTNISCHNKNDGQAIAVSSGQTPIQYLWSDNATTDTISNLTAGSYSVTVTDATHCTGTASTTIINPDSLYANAVLISDSCSAGAGSISVTVYGGTSPYRYVWSPGSNVSATNTALDSGTYMLNVTDAHSCVIMLSYTIGDTCIVDSLLFPTAFSPNNDGKNETFGPIYTGSVTDYQLHIYNRWGELIFQSNDAAKGWDGTYKSVQQPSGIYSYFASFTERKTKAVQGTFTLFK